MTERQKTPCVDNIIIIGKIVENIHPLQKVFQIPINPWNEISTGFLIRRIDMIVGLLEIPSAALENFFRMSEFQHFAVVTIIQNLPQKIFQNLIVHEWTNIKERFYIPQEGFQIICHQCLKIRYMFLKEEKIFSEYEMLEKIRKEYEEVYFQYDIIKSVFRQTTNLSECVQNYFGAYWSDVEVCNTWPFHQCLNSYEI